jgi:gluconate 2-dehydrogenase gamma chain
MITRREALRRTALLLGGAVSAPTLAGVLAGCGRDVGNGGATGLRLLTPWQHAMVATIAEHIIPETDTPGARAAGVDRFIDEMLVVHYSAAERDRFLAGLAGVDTRTLRAGERGFLESTFSEQRAVLTAIDRETFGSDPTGPGAVSVEGAVDGAVYGEPDDTVVGAADDAAYDAADDVPRLRDTAEAPSLPASAGGVRWIHGEVRGPERPEVPFFRTMKELTIVGYYTSEVGATVELRHEAVPGRHQGCVPFTEIGRAWAV